MTPASILNGRQISYLSRVGDLENRISIGTAAAFLAKDRFKESMPYSTMYDVDSNISYYINRHFVAETRRQLSGNEELGTSTYSHEEKAFYENYVKYLNDEAVDDMLTAPLEELDDWLIRELTNTAQPVLNRDYELTHKWNKTEDYTTEKGIIWI